MKRVFDDSFKRMAVELSYVKGSVTEVAKSLELDAYYIMQLVLDKELEHYKINVS